MEQYYTSKKINYMELNLLGVQIVNFYLVASRHFVVGVIYLIS